VPVGASFGTASDKYGRTAEWKPQGGEPSFVTIVQ